MKPVIGITVDLYASEDPILGPEYKLRANYCQRIVEAGGNPIILPTLADMTEAVHLLDGWLIPGGRDIDPVHFGQERHPASELQDPSRFRTERALYEMAPAGMPILGICYGCQFLNVMRGGDIEQHIPDRTNNRVHEGGTVQQYQVAPESQTHAVLGAAVVEGRSYHHQALGQVGANLEVSARHEDGTIEAIEDIRPDRWLFGVQWHPERSPDEAATQRLFASFIEAARRYRLERLA